MHLCCHGGRRADKVRDAAKKQPKYPSAARPNQIPLLPHMPCIVDLILEFDLSWCEHSVKILQQLESKITIDSYWLDHVASTAPFLAKKRNFQSPSSVHLQAAHILSRQQENGFPTGPSLACHLQFWEAFLINFGVDCSETRTRFLPSEWTVITLWNL